MTVNLRGVEHDSNERLTGAQSMLRVLGKMGWKKSSRRRDRKVAAWEALAEPGVEACRSTTDSHEGNRRRHGERYAKSTGTLPAVVIHTTVGRAARHHGDARALHEQVPMVVFAGESSAFGEDEGPDVGGQWQGHWRQWAGVPNWSITRSNGASVSTPSRSFRHRAARLRLAMAGRAGPCSYRCRWNICSTP